MGEQFPPEQRPPYPPNPPFGGEEQRPSHKAPRQLGAFLLGVLLALALFASGNLFAELGIVNLGTVLGFQDARVNGSPDGDEGVSLVQVPARVQEAATILEADALHEFTQEEIDRATDSAVSGLIEASGDPYAIYYSAADYEQYLRDSSGEYGGIGVTLTDDEGAVTVTEVFSDSPAEEAGVIAGDTIIAIDGVRKEWTTEEAVGAIRREEGTSVTLVWGREDGERETTMTLRAIIVPIVTTHLLEVDGAKVGYLSLSRFTMDCADDLRRAIEDFETLGVDGYILDLRGNPGGFLVAAIGVTSLFVPEGVVLQIEDHEGIVTKKVTGKMATDKPVVVLVDGNSASASEIVAGAFKDYGRATIVGETTYGKGTVQDVVMLSWGGAIRFTVAHYLSPLGHTIDKVGVVPDVEVTYKAPEVPEDMKLADRLAHSLSNDAYVYERGWDNQLDSALSVFTSEP